MKLCDILGILENSDRLRIIRGGEDIFIGFLALLHITEGEAGLTGEEEVEKFRVVPELKHKYWKERALQPPLEPDQTAQYSFSDLEMKLYYTIYIKS